MIFQEYLKPNDKEVIFSKKDKKNETNRKLKIDINKNMMNIS